MKGNHEKRMRNPQNGEKNTQKLFMLGRAYGNVGCRESMANGWVGGLDRD